MTQKEDKPDNTAKGKVVGDQEKPEDLSSFSNPDQEDESSEEDSQTESSDDSDSADEEEQLVDDSYHSRDYLEEDIFYREQRRPGVHWSVAWSDLMMTMFIFFVVLYAYSVANRDFLTGPGLGTDIGSSLGTGMLGEGGGGGLGDATVPAGEILPKIFDLSILAKTEEAEILREFASVELAPDKTVRIILTGDLFFDLGQAEIKSKAREKLIKIAKLIRRSPNMVNIVGHTDNIPMRSARFPSNWELSVIRATVVARFLIEEMHLAGTRFYVSGHAYYQPVKPNTTAKNRAANRRVEIVITKEMPQAITGTGGEIL